MTQLLTIPEAMARLNLGKTKVTALVRSGSLPSVKIGSARRIPESAVDAFVVELLSGADLGANP